MQELVFVLVQPAREENIGAAARALKTMGINQLWLVTPQANHKGERAMATAHGSSDILENARIFDAFEPMIASLDLVIGSAAKKRNVAQTYRSIHELPQIISEKKGTITSVGILFGCEESGLSNEQLAQCDILTTIPMHAKYPSLNLAQAVMVYAYELSKLTLNGEKEAPITTPHAEFSIMKEKARQILTDVELLPNNLIYPRIMNRLTMLNKDDMNLFHSFCKYYLKKYHGRLK